jgi:dihydrofolate synthase/folylpolyglutamate synthase
MATNLQQVLQTLNNPGNAIIEPGIMRMQLIMHYLGNPQNCYKSIHITGSNGKGSTANFISNGLVHAGFRVGKYTSPYIKSINEAIILNNQQITDKDLISTFDQVNYFNHKYNIQLSPFELLTAMMFAYFRNQQIDFLVLEVGMGGLLDATNIVYPIVSIITNISLEHTKWLGNTLNTIAKHKAGIVKNNYTIIADMKPELLMAVNDRTGNFTNVTNQYKLSVNLDYTDYTTKVTINEYTYKLVSFGKFQALNFLCAYATFKYLGINQQSILYSASISKLPGRLDIVSHKPLLIIDGAHNIDGIFKLVESLSNNIAANDTVLVVSILKDKDVNGMLNLLTQLATTIIYTTISNNPRNLSTTELDAIGKGKFINSFMSDNLSEGLSLAHTLNKKRIIVTGSLYLLDQFY